MIRRDYIMRMIEEFIRALAKIVALKNGRRWGEASVALDEEFKRLIGCGAQSVAHLSETELLARLLQGEPTQAVRQKTLLLTTLLKEAADVAAAEGRTDASHDCYLKALHLLLETLAGGEVIEWPEFVPKIDRLVSALDPAPPPRTQVMLMQHYEHTGEFAKAENALFALLDAEPGNEALADFGVSFYQRLLEKTDAALSEGNLPRAEAEEGLKELQRRRRPNLE